MIQVNETRIETISIFSEQRRISGKTRDCLIIDLNSSYQVALSLFSDITSLSIIELATEPDTNTQGEISYDYSQYCILGYITDHMNGTMSVCVYKKTQEELLEETIDSLMSQVLGVL